MSNESGMTNLRFLKVETTMFLSVDSMAALIQATFRDVENMKQTVPLETRQELDDHFCDGMLRGISYLYERLNEQTQKAGVNIDLDSMGLGDEHSRKL